MMFHIFHDWEKWEAQKGKDGFTFLSTVFENGNKRPMYSVYYLFRECETCGLQQCKRVKI